MTSPISKGPPRVAPYPRNESIRNFQLSRWRGRRKTSPKMMAKTVRSSKPALKRKFMTMAEGTRTKAMMRT